MKDKKAFAVLSLVMRGRWDERRLLMPDFLRDAGNLRHMTIYVYCDIRLLKTREIG